MFQKCNLGIIEIIRWCLLTQERLRSLSSVSSDTNVQRVLIIIPIAIFLHENQTSRNRSILIKLYPFRCVQIYFKRSTPIPDFFTIPLNSSEQTSVKLRITPICPTKAMIFFKNFFHWNAVSHFLLIARHHHLQVSPQHLIALSLAQSLAGSERSRFLTQVPTHWDCLRRPTTPFGTRNIIVTFTRMSRGRADARG